jgi:hypothetical protein
MANLSLRQILEQGNGLYGEHPNLFTDKECATGHSYCAPYEQAITKRKNVRLLEIGISSGGSLWTWRRWFEDYSLTAIDLAYTWISRRPFQEELEQDPNIELRWSCDSTKTDSYKDMEPFDYIIDDGCHEDNVQIATFHQAYPLLKQGGTYFIEDVIDESRVEKITNAIFAVDPTAKVDLYLGDKIKQGRLDDIIIKVTKQ